MMNTKHYLTLLSIFALLFLAGVAAVNYWVNPYLMFNTPSVNGVNAIKADISNYVRQAKAYHPLHQPINTLLVGNSRIEMGMNPAHACFDGPAYNLGIPGAGVELQVAYAANLIRQQQNIKTIVMSVDFVDFIHSEGKAPRTTLSTFGQDRLRYFVDGRLNDGYHLERFKDYYMALLSLDATVSSIKTLALQRASSSHRTPLGFNPAHDLAESTAVESAKRVFDQTVNKLTPFLQNKEYTSVPFEQNASFVALHTLIDLAKRRQIALYIFISPLHDSFYTMMSDAGLDNDLATWRRDITAFINERIEPGRFFDFSHMEGYTDEPYPAQAQTKPLAWFWEPAHYNEQLGNLLIQRMLDCDVQ